MTRSELHPGRSLKDLDWHVPQSTDTPVRQAAPCDRSITAGDPAAAARALAFVRGESCGQSRTAGGIVFPLGGANAAPSPEDVRSVTEKTARWLAAGIAAGTLTGRQVKDCLAQPWPPKAYARLVNAALEGGDSQVRRAVLGGVTQWAKSAGALGLQTASEWLEGSDRVWMRTAFGYAAAVAFARSSLHAAFREVARENVAFVHKLVIGLLGPSEVTALMRLDADLAADVVRSFLSPASQQSVAALERIHHGLPNDVRRKFAHQAHKGVTQAGAALVTAGLYYHKKHVKLILDSLGMEFRMQLGENAAHQILATAAHAPAKAASKLLPRTLVPLARVAARLLPGISAGIAAYEAYQMIKSIGVQHSVLKETVRQARLLSSLKNEIVAP